MKRFHIDQKRLKTSQNLTAGRPSASSAAAAGLCVSANHNAIMWKLTNYNQRLCTESSQTTGKKQGKRKKLLADSRVENTHHSHTTQTNVQRYQRQQNNK